MQIWASIVGDFIELEQYVASQHSDFTAHVHIIGKDGVAADHLKLIMPPCGPMSE